MSSQAVKLRDWKACSRNVGLPGFVYPYRIGPLPQDFHDLSENEENPFILEHYSLL